MWSAADGTLAIADFSDYLLNEWAMVQFAHNQAAALVTGTFAIAAMGAFYMLRGQHLDQARLYLRDATIAGLVASVLVAFPTGDAQAKIVARLSGAGAGGDGRPLRVRTDGRPDDHRPAQCAVSAEWRTRSGCAGCSATSRSARFMARSADSMPSRVTSGQPTSSCSTTRST